MPGFFECRKLLDNGDTECYPQDSVCNRYPDCIDESDEANCQSNVYYIVKLCRVWVHITKNTLVAIFIGVRSGGVGAWVKVAAGVIQHLSRTSDPK